MNQTSTENILLSVVLPCYNPIQDWHHNVINNIKLIESKLGGKIHLTIVNDGSTHGITEQDYQLIENSHSNLNIIKYNQNKGKGYALRQGINSVKNFPIIYTDIDFPYTTDSFIKVFNALNNNYDAVLGKRNNDYYDNTPFVRKIISKTLRGVFKHFLRLATDDTQCGIKGFNQKGAKIFMDTEIDRFLFDLEFVKLLSKRQMNVTTVDVELKPNIVFSKVNSNILAKESLNFIRVLFRK